MKLKNTQIPHELRQTVPPGFRLEQRGDFEYLIVESIFCRHGHNLLVNSVKIHGEPAIKLHVKIGKSEGVIFVDAFWGSHAKLYSFLPEEVTPTTSVEAFCPVCGTSLMEEYTCREPECDSTRGIVLYLPGDGNTVHVCARLNCPGHHLNIIDVPDAVINTISAINYFGVGAFELFGE
ncbi:MAG: hypothetical protein K9M84_06830 [Spirochaetia bacterium]|nr:hypothetical protein [Spirochaetia bacterium]